MLVIVRSAAARLLEPRVHIPLVVRIFVMFVVCCVGSGLITRSEKSCCVCLSVCVIYKPEQ